MMDIAKSVLKDLLLLILEPQNVSLVAVVMKQTICAQNVSFAHPDNSLLLLATANFVLLINIPISAELVNVCPVVLELKSILPAAVPVVPSVNLDFTLLITDSVKNVPKVLLQLDSEPLTVILVNVVTLPTLLEQNVQFANLELILPMVELVKPVQSISTPLRQELVSVKYVELE